MPATNRIVVDYGGERKLAMLARVHTATGQEASHETLQSYTAHGFDVAKSYDGIKDFRTLTAVDEWNREGFVVRFIPSNTRVKLKFETYKRLHRILTGISARRIWELLSQNQSLDPILERVPDEFYQWVQTVASKLRLDYYEIELYCQQIVAQVRHLPTRKEQAAEINRIRVDRRGICFRMLDGKPCDEAIWKLLYPSAERPFRQDEEV